MADSAYLHFKRASDFTAALCGLILLGPLLGVTALVIWLYDRSSPLYIAARTGRYGKPFFMIKFRTMVNSADALGGPSTSVSDSRITPIGAILRRCKFDELPQLINVLLGHMSLVGPRPQVPSEVANYTERERLLLDLRPGITDIASVVFADEGSILSAHSDISADAAYNLYIRPWKSRLALQYREHVSFRADLQILIATFLNPVARPAALRLMARLLRRWGVDEGLVAIAYRSGELPAGSPPE